MVLNDDPSKFWNVTIIQLPPKSREREREKGKQAINEERKEWKEEVWSEVKVNLPLFYDL